MAAELLHIVSHIGYDVCKELSSQIYEIENENETDWFIQQKGCCLWKLPKNDFHSKMIDFDTLTKIA